MALQPINCKCETCQKMCQRPCWGTPADIQKIIDAGLGDRLMLDYWEAKDRIEILCPAIAGRESSHAPFWPVGWCTFYLVGLCALHDKGLKPTEGKLAYHEDRPGDETLHEDMMRSWDTDEGRQLVKYWKQEYMK